MRGLAGVVSYFTRFNLGFARLAFEDALRDEAARIAPAAFGDIPC